MRVIRHVRSAGLVVALCALALTVSPAPAQAAPKPQGIYAGMGNCPLGSSIMRNPTNLQVGCVYSVTRGGSVTIGNITTPLTSPITIQFGTYWPADAPTVEFPDGSVANLYKTVAPADGRVLVSSPIQVPIPGIGNIIPGVTSVFAAVEVAGPITNFAPLSAGEDYPVFILPIKLHLFNALFGLHCYIGSNSSPIYLRPTAGTTSPPRPNLPITGDPGVIDLLSDPNGFETIVASFTGATLLDNTLSVPKANGCGLFGALDGLINLAFGVPSASGRNTVIFSQTNTSLAISPNITDLSNALAASSS